MSGAAGQALQGHLDDRARARLRALAQLGAVLLMGLGTAVLLGWALGLQALTSGHPRLVSVKANAALGLWLVGLSLRRSLAGPSASRLRGWPGALAALLGVLTLVECVAGWDLGIDEAVFVDRASRAAGTAPGRMSIATASLLTCLGTAAALLARASRGAIRAAQWLSLLVALGGLLSLLGYLYGVHELHAVGAFSSIALYTTLAFLIGAGSLLGATADTGFVAAFTAAGPGRDLARRLLPAALLLPPLIGWARLQGQRAGLYDLEFGLGLFAAANVICFSVLIQRAALALSRADARRQGAEARLRANEQSLAITLNSIGDAVIATDVAGCITRMNPVAETLTGWPQAEALGRPLAQVLRVLDEHTKQPIEAPVEQALREGVVVELGNHAILQSRDGRVRPIADSGAPIRDAAGVVQGLVLVFRDQAAERAAEQALLESDARKGAILEAALDCIVAMDHIGLITEFNPAAERAFGRSRESVLGKPLVELIIPPGLREAHLRGLQRYLDTGVGHVLGKRVELRALRSDGCEFPVELAVVRTRSQGPPTFTAYIRDVTERQRAAGALQESEARFRHLSQSGILGIIIVDTLGKIHDANDAFLSLLGYAHTDVAGGELRWPELTPPEWHAADEAALRQLELTGVATPWEKEYFRKDGTRVPVFVGVAMLAPPQAIAFVLDLSERKRAEEAKARALSVAEEQLAQRARVESALRETEEQLRQSQKMEAIGTLAGGIAHDFNNLLSVILGYANLMLDDLQASDPLREDLAEVRKAAEGAAELTRQLLAFSRQQVLEPKVLDLNEAIASMAKMLRRIIGEDVELTFAPEPSLGSVFVDPGQIGQVLLNLSVNARDAMPRGGKLTIATANVELDETYAQGHPEVTPGPHVMLSVSDTGVGMDRATQARAFEPFYTTKERGKGTGLGLSTVFGIVKQSGGSIWLYSEPGQGTTFKIYFRRTDAAPTPFTLQSAAPGTQRGSETVLLVEDDDQVRNLAATILRRNGYDVLEAASGNAALQLVEHEPRTIHVLLTDVVMPHMSGRELWARLAPLRPNMKVLFMSGYTDDAIVHHGVLRSELAFVQKPLMPGPLLTKLRAVLDGASTPVPRGAGS